MRSAAHGARLEIRYTTEALQRCLERLETEYSAYQEERDREAVFGYLTAVFETVAWWYLVGRAEEFAQRALCLQRSQAPKIVDPFAAIIFCTSDSGKVDFKTRSKWARVLRYAKVFKDPDEPLHYFVRTRGGINKCARRYSRRLGRSNRVSD
jgi:hypothetical protein